MSNRACNSCYGVEFPTCPECRGEGRTLMWRAVQDGSVVLCGYMEGECPRCGGAGSVPCSSCKPTLSRKPTLGRRAG